MDEKDLKKDIEATTKIKSEGILEKKRLGMQTYYRHKFQNRVQEMEVKISGTEDKMKKLKLTNKLLNLKEIPDTKHL